MKIKKELLENISQGYKNLNEESSIYEIEIAYYKQLQNYLKWQSLSDEKKQEKRKAKVENLQHKLYKNESDAFLNYEIAVVDLYDKIIHTLQCINNMKNISYSVNRLYVMIFFEKELINQYSLISKITHIDKQVVENIFQSLTNESLSDDLNLLELHKSFQKLYFLLPEKPYRL